MSAPQSVAYLGPAGTFTEQALLTQQDLAQATHRLCSSISDAMFCANNSEVDMAFVAIENSIEGSVNVTLDMLGFETDLLIQKEVVIPVELHLLALPQAQISDITEVLSYPHALGQCRDFLRAKLPEARLTPDNSTAEAVASVSLAKDPSKAAVGTELAGEIHGLVKLAEGVEDRSGNQTRFVAVATDHIPQPTGQDKTSLVVFQRENQPGSLLSILQEFANRDIDLNKLQSRPTKQALGEYCFFIDMEGHIDQDHVKECLDKIRSEHADVKFLGSYPVAS